MAFELPSPEEVEGLSPSDKAQLAALCLQGLETGRQPFALFKELRRLVVMSTVEVVPFLILKMPRKVLLGRRPTGPEEPWWGGMLNLPGSVILPKEPRRDPYDLSLIVDRILRTEFSGSIRRLGLVTVFNRQLIDAKSGTENKTFVHTAVKLAAGHDSVINGQFFDAQDVVNNPPELLVDGHAETVRLALLDLQTA